LMGMAIRLAREGDDASYVAATQKDA